MFGMIFLDIPWIWKIAYDLNHRITYLEGEPLVFAADQSETERNSSLPLERGEFFH